MLHLPAAFDEMNKSRRTTALQARALARAGAVVAMLDPRGTGDSEHEHRDATWESWREDAQLAFAWLRERAAAPCIAWGTRLGALLAAQLVASRAIPAHALLLWQPVASGRSFFNQFLRVATAQQLTDRHAPGVDTRAVRTALASGVVVEIAGYALNPQLVAGAEAVELEALDVPRCPVVWRESTPSNPPTLSPSTRATAARWTAAGADVDVRAICGPSFWAAQEIAEASSLVDDSTSAVARLVAKLGVEP